MKTQLVPDEGQRGLQPTGIVLSISILLSISYHHLDDFGSADGHMSCPGALTTTEGSSEKNPKITPRQMSQAAEALFPALCLNSHETSLL